MCLFASSSIEHKLTAIITLTCSCVVVLACVAFVINDVITFRQTMVEDLATTAKLIARASTDALKVDDARSGLKTLSMLSADPHILTSCLYGTSGSLFAGFTNEKASPASSGHACSEDDRWYRIDKVESGRRRAKDGTFLFNDHFQVTELVVLDGKPIGIVVIESDLRKLHARMWRCALVSLLITVVSMIAAFLLSFVVRRSVSEPILELSKAVRTFSQHRDYFIPLRKKSDDEMGTLIEGFNSMVEQIRLCENQLKEHGPSLQDHLPEPLDAPRLDAAAEGRYEESHSGSEGVEQDGGPFRSDSRPALIDRAALDSIRALQREGAPDLLAKIVQSYRESSVQLIRDLREAVSAGDSKQARHAAHSLKSSSANLGALAMVALCKQFEALAHSGSLEGAAALLTEVEAEHSSVLDALSEEIRQRNSGTKQ